VSPAAADQAVRQSFPVGGASRWPVSTQLAVGVALGHVFPPGIRRAMSWAGAGLRAAEQFPMSISAWSMGLMRIPPRQVVAQADS